MWARIGSVEPQAIATSMTKARARYMGRIVAAHVPFFMYGVREEDGKVPTRLNHISITARPSDCLILSLFWNSDFPKQHETNPLTS